jgi:hypothetical protein
MQQFPGCCAETNHHRIFTQGTGGDKYVKLTDDLTQSVTKTYIKVGLLTNESLVMRRND